MDNTSKAAVDRKKEQPNDKLASESRTAPGADQSINQYWANLTHNLAIQGLIGKGVLPDTKITSPSAPKGETPAQARQPETKPKVEQAPAPGAAPAAGSPKPEGAPEKPAAIKARPQELPKTTPAKVPAEVPANGPANLEGAKAKPEATPEELILFNQSQPRAVNRLPPKPERSTILATVPVMQKLLMRWW